MSRNNDFLLDYDPKELVDVSLEMRHFEFERDNKKSSLSSCFKRFIAKYMVIKREKRKIKKD
jgi:hypothetical protein